MSEKRVPREPSSGPPPFAAAAAAEPGDEKKQLLMGKAGRDDDLEDGFISGEKGEERKSTVFNRGERPVQDAIFGRIFVAGMLLMLVREVAVFFWPLLGLPFFDLASFAVAPFLAIIVGVLLALPGCFLLLWATKRISASTVKVCLILCLVFFLFNLLSTLAFHTTPPQAGTADYPEHFTHQSHASGYPEQGTELPSSSSSSSSWAAHGSFLPASEQAMLQAAIPGSLSRILLSSAHSLLPHTFRLRLHALSHPSWGRAAAEGIALGGDKGRAEAEAEAGRGTGQSAPLWALLQRRRLQMGPPVRDGLVLVKKILTNVVNAVGVLLLLLYCHKYFALVALIISDSSNFVLTRGRGIVFAILTLTAAAVLSSFPSLSTALKLTRICLLTEPGAPEAANGGASPAAPVPPPVCAEWGAAIVPGSAVGILFALLAFFLAAWLCLFLQLALQFMAAHVVGQCYGHTQPGLEEDDVHVVLHAGKCAVGPSFGSLCFMSLILAAVLALSFLVNMAFMVLFGDSPWAAIPLLLNSCATFAISLFFASFTLPLMALTGQSFLDAARAALRLLQRVTLPSVAVALSTMSVVGLLVFFIFIAVALSGLLLVAVLLSAGSMPGMPLALFFLLLFTLCLLSSVGSVALFNWVFSAIVMTTFTCLALEGKTEGELSSTPLAVADG